MNKILISSLIFMFSNIFSQKLQNIGSIKIGSQGLELGYSRILSPSFSGNIGLGIGSGNNLNDGTAEYVLDVANPTPFIRGGISWLYNSNKRLIKGKSIHNNSSNFITLQSKYSFGKKNDFELNETQLTEIIWGIQRSIGKNFFYTTHLGVGYLKDYTLHDGNLTPTIGFSIGYVFFRH